MRHALRPARYLLLATLAACASGDVPPALFLPDTVDVEWEEAWNADDDGLVALVPVDVMAYDAGTGAPVPDVALTVGWLADGATDIEVLPVERVGWEPDDTRGDAWWDARRDAFFRVLDAALPPGLEPGLEAGTHVVTDPDGVARFYLLVDALSEPGDVGGIPVTASLFGGAVGDSGETFLLVPR